MFGLISIACLIAIAVSIIRYYLYMQTAYYRVTQNSGFLLRRDSGKYGEYLIYKYLRHFEKEGARFLFNLYIPKGDGETTEIDVLMIHPKCIFVIESKNYSGWIFGNERQKSWCQTLPSGRRRSHKEFFYNPIMQNNTHVKYLKELLGENIPLRSVVVFSDRCVFKDIRIDSNHISIIHRSHAPKTLQSICDRVPSELFDDEKVLELYQKLYPYSQVDAVQKMQHIANIRRKQGYMPVKEEVYTAPEVSFAAAISNMETEQEIPVHAAGDQPVVMEMAVGTEPIVVAEEHPDTLQNNCEPVLNAVDAEAVRADKNQEKKSLRETAEAMKCPLCNSNLVLRTATRGAYSGNRFYGCSNYPRCKYMQNLSEIIIPKRNEDG